MNLKSIKEFPKEKLKGLKVLVRSELDTPYSENGIVDPKRALRLKSSLRTIEYLKEFDARIIVISHIGRDSKNTLKYAAKELGEIAKCPVGFAPDIFAEELPSVIDALPDGGILVLENLRSYKEEEAGDDSFAKLLASFADIFVMDAFSNGHREHASMVKIPQHIQTYVGLQFFSEVSYLEKIQKPEKPLVVVMGGFKVATKLPVISSMRKNGAEVYVCGALAHPLLKARGYSIGLSTCDKEADVSKLVDDPHVHVPSRVIVERENTVLEVKVFEVEEEDTIVDIAPSAFDGEFSSHILGAKTIIWNGPLGFYEKGYTRGTTALLELLEESGGVKVAGGSDTISAISLLGFWDAFDFVSMAGGATLHFLGYGTLPVLKALEK